MTAQEIRENLFALQEVAYGDFLAKLIPTLDRSRIIGVRTPALRKLAKELYQKGEYNSFLNELPHTYLDENNLHSFIICEIKSYDEAIRLINSFLPYVDNWATCDQMSPKSFKKNRHLLESEIEQWLVSERTYTVRFGLEMIQTHFLNEDFSPVWLDRAAAVRSDEYYVNMMQAWFFATALTERWNDTLPYIEQNKLDVWSHNKAIRKAIESKCISEERKIYLRTLKRGD